MNYTIIAVDFDGTLCYSNWPELGEPNTALIEYLRAQQERGNKLILWTCRAGEALERAVSWCHDQNLDFDAVNDNLPEIVEQYGSNSRKITCDVYIDDRAFHVNDYDNAGEVDINRIESALISFADRVVMVV